MKTSCLKQSKKWRLIKGDILFSNRFSIILLFIIVPVSNVTGQSILFDFDSAPVYSPLPINQTVSGVTAYFTASGQGYSIQNTSTATVVPVGFTGGFIFPSSIYLSDLYIKYNQSITDFSIMYSTQELACDDAATMRVTAYMNGNLIGTNTQMTAHPGTWPVDTLSCSFPIGFDSVVVHYASPPPTCADYGVIFMVDNMRITPLNVSISEPALILEGLTVTNPISQIGTISFTLAQSQKINIALHDLTGRRITTVFDGYLSSGQHKLNWNANNEIVSAGIYILNITAGNFNQSFKVSLLK